MAYRFSQRSLERLKGIHPDLVDVMLAAIKVTPIDFTILEGLRTKQRQAELVAQGASTTMNSRHLTGHAVDVAPWINGGISWHWPHYYPLAECIKECAKDLNVPIEWGGDWKRFKDGPHWQLSWEEYPK